MYDPTASARDCSHIPQKIPTGPRASQSSGNKSWHRVAAPQIFARHGQSSPEKRFLAEKPKKIGTVCQIKFCQRTGWQSPAGRFVQGYQASRTQQRRSGAQEQGRFQLGRLWGGKPRARPLRGDCAGSATTLHLAGSAGNTETGTQASRGLSSRPSVKNQSRSDAPPREEVLLSALICSFLKTRPGPKPGKTGSGVQSSSQLPKHVPTPRATATSGWFGSTKRILPPTSLNGTVTMSPPRTATITPPTPL